MELKSTRRIVTGHDAQGKAIVVFDAPLQAKQRAAGGNGMTLLWVDQRISRRRRRLGRPRAKATSACRRPQTAPYSASSISRRRRPHDGAGRSSPDSGVDGHRSGDARLWPHANTHRTRTVDYAIVLDGEIDMLLDDTEIHVKAGDVLVQQATNHAWVNNGTKPCRIAFILIDGKTPPAWQQGWTK